jgi:Arc/MetJ family transcription regulator
MMHIRGISSFGAHMRTTLNIDERLVDEAKRLTGMKERTEVIHEGLRALISRESARRLAKLGGTEPGLKAIPRRRPADS